MKIRYAYDGLLNGVRGVWTDEIPKGAEVRNIIFLTADDCDHELKNKKTKEVCSSVIIKDESEKEMWEEIEREKFPWELDEEEVNG